MLVVSHLVAASAPSPPAPVHSSGTFVAYSNTWVFSLLGDCGTRPPRKGLRPLVGGGPAAEVRGQGSVACRGGRGGSKSVLPNSAAGSCTNGGRGGGSRGGGGNGGGGNSGGNGCNTEGAASASFVDGVDGPAPTSV